MSGHNSAASSSTSADDKPALSIICVFNDVEVRKACLDRSIEDHRSEGIDVELIAVDNRQNAFGTAGEALNHGAGLATSEFLVFVHQDVYLHSLSALAAAAGMLRDASIGMLGAVGVRSDGSVVGRIRDRVLLIGAPAAEPVDVDSLDEVLFLLSKERWQADPLSTEPDLAWHAYAVEYGVRMTSRRLRVAAIDIPVTHNSLTTNLAKLDRAHAAVASMYPTSTPVRTTCGTVGAGSAGWRKLPLLRTQRWRYRWLKESIAVRALRAAVPGTHAVLFDIRQNIDSVLAASPVPLQVFNVGQTQDFDDQRGEPLELTRLGRLLEVRVATLDDVLVALQALPLDSPVLLTNMQSEDLVGINGQLAGRRAVLGHHADTGNWLLLGGWYIGNVVEWQAGRARPILVGAMHAKPTPEIGQLGQAPLRD